MPGVRQLLLLTALLLSLCVTGCDNAAKSSRDTDEKQPQAKDRPSVKADTPAFDDAKKKGLTEGDPNAEFVKLTPVDKREELFLDFNTTDQDGKAYNLESVLGKPTVATFIFTRCPNPTMCPGQAMRLAGLQKRLEDEGLADKVNLLLISFDPTYDTPQRLKEFASRNFLKFTDTVRAIRPKPAELQELLGTFRTQVYPPDPTGQINHKSDLFVLDQKGQLAVWLSGIWYNQHVLTNVKQLLEEAKQKAPTPAAEGQ